jgi:hypothetical protein
VVAIELALAVVVAAAVDALLVVWQRQWSMRKRRQGLNPLLVIMCLGK